LHTWQGAQEGAANAAAYLEYQIAKKRRMYYNILWLFAFSEHFCYNSLSETFSDGEFYCVLNNQQTFA